MIKMQITLLFAAVLLCILIPGCPAPEKSSEPPPSVNVRVLISGQTQVHQLLTANVSGVNENDQITYIWKRGASEDGPFTVIPGAVNSTYLITLDELGKCLVALAGVTAFRGSLSYYGETASAAVGPVEPSGNVFPVSFNITNDSETTIATVTIPEGDTANRPVNPDKAGYFFDAWYIDEECKVPFNFSTSIIKAMELYAKWIKLLDVSVSMMEGKAQVGEKIKVIVTGENLTGLLYEWKHGNSAGGPFQTIPGAEDDEYTLTADDLGKYIITVITRDGNLGAAQSLLFGPVLADDLTVYTVTFNTAGGSVIFPVFVADGDTITKPANPVKTGFALSAWYEDAQYTAPFDFEIPVTSDMTLYAKWDPVMRVIDFEKLTDFRETASSGSMPLKERVIYDFQRGGDVGPTWTLSSEQNHTPDGSQSLRWGNRTVVNNRIKFDNIFSAADIGRKFEISLWIYSTSAADSQIRVGAYNMSGVSDAGYSTNATSGLTLKSFDINPGWNEVIWTGYTHTTERITQLGLDQPNAVPVVGLLYIDDIMIKASDVTETEVKKIVFDNLAAFEMTPNPSGGIVKDWQPVSPVDESNVALSSEQDHTTGYGKSLKFSGRTGTSNKIKFDKIFSPVDTGSVFNISMWVYMAQPSWIQLTVFPVDGVTSNVDAIARSFARAETGWTKLEWTGYRHTNAAVTQLGIEQDAAESVADTIYIDDIVVIKITP